MYWNSGPGDFLIDTRQVAPEPIVIQAIAHYEFVSDFETRVPDLDIGKQGLGLDQHRGDFN